MNIVHICFYIFCLVVDFRSIWHMYKHAEFVPIVDLPQQIHNHILVHTYLKVYKRYINMLFWVFCTYTLFFFYLLILFALIYIASIIVIIINCGCIFSFKFLQLFAPSYSYYSYRPAPLMHLTPHHLSF